MTLFRSELEDARANAWLGRVVLIRPLSFSFLAALAMIFTIALAAFFWFGEYTRKARVTGVLAPAQGVVKILAQQPGVVEAVHAREGAVVERDAPLVILGDPRTTNEREDVGAVVAARLRERQRALEAQRVHALAAMRSEQMALALKKAGLERELRQLDAELATHAQREAIAEQGAARARRLEGIGFLSPAAADRERDAALDQRSRMQGTQRSRTALVSELAAIAFEMTTARARANAQIAALDAQKAATAQERVERDAQFRTAIIAPGPGLIATVLVEPGQMVIAGTPLATVIPSDAELEAHLFSPSRSIGFVREGQEVLLRYLAYPYQKFGQQRAAVVAISRNPMLPGELGFTPLDGTREPLYRIKAALESQAIRAYGRLEPLQPGMQVEADILLDRRRLIEWIFEPLLSLAGRA